MAITPTTKIIPHHIPALKIVSTASQLVNNSKLNIVILNKLIFFMIIYFLMFIILNSVSVGSPVFDRFLDLVSRNIFMKCFIQKILKVIIIRKPQRCNLIKSQLFRNLIGSQLENFKISLLKFQSHHSVLQSQSIMLSDHNCQIENQKNNYRK